MVFHYIIYYAFLFRHVFQIQNLCEVRLYHKLKCLVHHFPLRGAIHPLPVKFFFDSVLGLRKIFKKSRKIFGVILSRNTKPWEKRLFFLFYSGKKRNALLNAFLFSTRFFFQKCQKKIFSPFFR